MNPEKAFTIGTGAVITIGVVSVIGWVTLWRLVRWAVWP